MRLSKGKEMKIFNLFKKKNKGVTVCGKSIIINNIDINKVFSECIARLDEAIKEKSFDDVKAIRDGLEQIQKEIEQDNDFVFDSNNCIYVNSSNINSNNINSYIGNNINSTAFFSSVVTNIGDGKKKAKIKQRSFFNRGNMAGGNIVISQNNINGDNFLMVSR